MMIEAIVLCRQSLLDMVLQHTGSLENALVVAQLNNLEMEQELKAGSIINIPQELVSKGDIASYYKSNTIHPATYISDQDTSQASKDEGIDYWAIELDFIVY